MKKPNFKKYFATFTPQSIKALKGYNGKKFTKDLLAGIIVAIIALPLSIALAIASGAPPAVGLITAGVAGFSAALFSGSRFQVTGPTGAFIITIYNIIHDYTYQGMLIATFMAGVFLLVLGLFKVGGLAKFIAKPINVGFTMGIAVTIFSTQIVDFFSLQLSSNPTQFFDRWITYFQALNTANFVTMGIGFGSLIFMLVWDKLKLKIPGSLIAVILSAVVVGAFALDVPTIGSKFGDLKMTLNFAFPFGDIKILSLIKPAVTIALLAAITSLLSAAAADNMSGSKTDNNAELVSQGVANMFSSCFGGLPATGAIARTSANIKTGAVSPISTMIHAVIILLVGLVLMPLVKLVPLSAFAAVLFIVCKNMIDIKELRKVFKCTISDMILFATTFVLTVVFDLLVAICVGVALSFVLLAVRMLIKKINVKALKLDVEIVDNRIVLSGMLNFLTVGTLLPKIKSIQNLDALENQVVSIDSSALHTIDMGGREALHALHAHYDNKNKEMLVARIVNTPKTQMRSDLEIDIA